MRARVIVVSLAFGAACARQPMAAISVPPPPPSASALAPAPAPVPPKGPPMHALVMGGPHAIENAAWMPDGSVVAVTYGELWRFRAEAPDALRVTPLALQASGSAVLAVARPGARAAVALDDGSVDVFEADGTRLRTLPPGRHVLELRFAPDGKTLAITRTHDKTGEWFERTAFVDLATAAIKSSVDGGNVVFDDDGKRVAARGGVFEIGTGRAVAKIPEGMYVVFEEGVMGDMRAPHRGVMAGDSVARGWSGGSAYYGLPLGKDVMTVAPDGAITRFAASCAPGKKLGTAADRARGRVVSVCTDGVVVSDIAKRSSNKIAFPIAKRVGLSAPDMAFFPESDTFGVKSRDFPLGVFDPALGTARPANAAERQRIWDFAFNEECAGAAGGRGDSICDNPAWRPDHAFRMRVHSGFAIWPQQSGAAPVIEWAMDPLGAGRGPSSDDDSRLTFDWRAGGLEVRSDERRLLRYRIGPPVAADPPSFAATAVCGAEPKPVVIQDAFALYISYVSAKYQITSTIVCHCSAHGCTKTTLGGMGTAIAATDDGAFATVAMNDTGTQSTLTLRAPGHAPVTARFPGNIGNGAFGPREHFFLTRKIDEHEELLELSLPTLALVRRHALPRIGRVQGLLRAGDSLLAMNADVSGWFGALLDADWLAADAPAREPPMLYAWPTYGILQGSDGKVRLYGDETAAAAAIRCYDGAKLRPFDASTCSKM